MSRYEMANELLTLREALKTSQIDPSDPEHAPWEKELAKKFHSQEAEIRAQIAALEMAIEHGPPTTRADLATVAQLTRRAKGDTAAD